MPELTREAILGLDDLTREEVQIPEWETSIFVRKMTAQEKDWLDNCAYDDEGKRLPKKERDQNFRGRLVALVACRQDGSSIFHLTDAEALGKKAWTALDRIIDVAIRVNAMTAEEGQTLSKNSVPIPGAVPCSDSPEPSV